MRISTLQVFNSGVSNMQKGQTALAQTQEQISTGKNLNRPSDDPVAAAQILKLRREITASDTYADNIIVSQRRLEQEEVVMQQVKDASDRINVLAIQGNNGTLSAQDRNNIANEIQQVQQFVLGLMNTKDASGEYLFSGSKGDTVPFVRDNAGGFSYQGDSEVRQIQTGPAAQVQSTDSGRAVFQVIPGDLGLELLNPVAGVEVSMAPSTTPGTASAFEQYVALNGKQDLTLSVTAAVPEGNLLAVPPETATSASYQLTDANGTVLLTDSFDPLVDTPDKWQLTDPATGLVLSIAPPVAELAWTATPAVTATGIRPVQPQHSILTSAQKLIDALRSPLGDETARVQFAADMSEAMDELLLAQDGVIQAQTTLGGRMVTLDDQQGVNDDFAILTKTALSSLEDLDYAAAIAKFSFQEVALQAAQQTFSRVNQLSLFNYL